MIKAEGGISSFGLRCRRSRPVLMRRLVESRSWRQRWVTIDASWIDITRRTPAFSRTCGTHNNVIRRRRVRSVATGIDWIRSEPSRGSVGLHRRRRRSTWCMPPAPTGSQESRRRLGDASMKKPLVCYGCGLPGHVIKFCQSARSGANGVRRGEPSETYIDINVCGTRYHCLLDTGCERSLAPRKLVPTATLRPTGLQVYAPNGKPIPMLGSMRLGFTVPNMPMHADLLISDDVKME